MKKLIALTIFAIAITGCNTIAGMGKDVQKAGQAVQGFLSVLGRLANGIDETHLRLREALRRRGAARRRGSSARGLRN